MALQVRIQDAIDTAIAVPWSTGLQYLDSQADAWLYRIPHPKDGGLTEYIITPISQAIWQDLWVITIITAELPGILGRTAKFLGDLGINIVSMNTSTIEQWQYHSMRLIVDCARYESDVDRKHDQRRVNPNSTLNHLKRLLAVEFIADLAPPPYPSVSIERCVTFWSLYQECIRANSMSPGKRLMVRDGRVKLPEVEIRRLLTDGSAPEDMKILVYVDQSAEMLRLLPFRLNQGIITISLSVTNIPGSIAAVMSCLGDNGFNIFASKAWTSGETDRTSLWLLLRNLRSHFPSVTDAAVRGDVLSLLTSEKKLDAYGMIIDIDQA